MSVLDLIPPAIRGWAIALVLLLIAGAGAAGAWVIQDWRYGNELSKQARTSSEQATARLGAVLATLTAEQGKRAALETRLQTNDKTHNKERTDAQKTHQRLLDDLATADVRLSVLLAATDAGRTSGDGVSAPASAGGVVHGATRAELDPAHARRIVSITGDGDQGLIALKACQGYVREVWEASQRQAPP